MPCTAPCVAVAWGEWAGWPTPHGPRGEVGPWGGQPLPQPLVLEPVASNALDSTMSICAGAALRAAPALVDYWPTHAISDFRFPIFNFHFSLFNFDFRFFRFPNPSFSSKIQLFLPKSNFFFQNPSFSSKIQVFPFLVPKGINRS